MKLLQLLSEANYINKIAKDPKKIKMLSIAIRHDNTFPKTQIAKLGPQPNEKNNPQGAAEWNEQLAKVWSDVLDSSLRRTKYGDISHDGYFDEWLFNMYVEGRADYEDINGEGGDALGAWKALSVRNLLRPIHKDILHKFKSIRSVQLIVQERDYRDTLRRIEGEAEVQRHKKEKKETIILDNDKYMAMIPYNYGACYTFNNEVGFLATFCTGSSSGLRWFNNYAPDGPIISFIDKKNVDDVNGKWQIHAPTNQINNGDQSVRRDSRFAELFPGAMKEIVAGIEKHAEEIHNNSKEITRGQGYDIAKAVNDLKNKFPESYNSETPKEEEEVDGPGDWLITHKPSGKTATFQADSKQDAKDKLLARYPNAQIDDFSFKLQQDQEQEESLGILN